MTIVDRTAYPSLAILTQAILDDFPDHLSFLEAGFRDREPDLMKHSELVASAIMRLSAIVEGGLPALASDYKFICKDVVFPEEVHFRRTGSYRLTSFKEALETVYSNGPYMKRYMNGLLLSNVIWNNHARALHHFATNFLPSLPKGAHLLEIGPGHGLLLYLATLTDGLGSISAWDISRTSLEMSRQALETMGAKRSVSFEERNIIESDNLESFHGKFDGVVFSEVLEHLEQPGQALEVLFRLCKPGGKAWINVPANSPAPDHIYLVKEPGQFHDLVRGAGFEIVESQNFPMTGYTLERAIRRKLTISCVAVGQRPA
jgi:2-polyprenyl-3-methyl-5-hydroxy-6-metoxy-1,4-benzoquinol methylase